MKTKFFLLCIGMLIGIHAKAADGDTFTAATAEGVEITYVILSEDDLTVKVGNSSTAAIDPATEGTVTIPSDVEHNDLIYTVTTVASYAFNGSASIEGVVIPDEVSTIGKNVFYGCSKMASVNLPTGITTIQNYTFYGCSSLTEIVIPEGVKTIGQQAFNGCSHLTSVEFPEGLLSIGNQAFRECSSLTSLTFPSTLTKIDAQAFYMDKKITKVIARMETPFSFGKNAFYKISTSCGLIVPEGTKDAYIAAGWDTSVFPRGILEGENSLFNGQTFTVSNESGLELTYKVTDTENKTVCYGDGTNPCIDNQTEGELVLDEMVEYNGVTYNITSIGTKAFYGCKDITTVTIPAAISAIDASAFQGCSSLTKVMSRIETPFAFGSNAFASISDKCSLHVPTGTKSDYINNGWTSAVFKGGVVEGDNALLVGDTFTAKDANGIDILYTITDVDEMLVKVGNSTDPAIDISTTGEISIPSQVEYEGVTYNVSTIATNAFIGCAGITTVTIGEGITTFGASVFSDCTALTAIALPSTLATLNQKVFNNCSSLETINLPAGIKSIPNYFFYGCSSLKEITVPEGVVSIGQQAFNGCSKLESVVLPEGLLTIGNQSFRGCTSLSSIELPSTLTKIDAQAFYQDKKLASVTAKMETPFAFGKNAFYNISTICGLHVPEGTKDAYIEKGWTKEVFRGGIVEGDDTPTAGFVFQLANEDGVDIVYVVRDVDEMTVNVGTGTAAAVDSNVGNTLTLPGTINYLNNTYTVYALANKSFADNENLTKVVVPENVKIIGENAFSGCTGLTGVELPSTLSTIGALAFKGCTALTNVVLPESLESMGANIFNGCSSLKTITIPGGLTEIPDYAFAESGLQSIVIPSNIVKIGLWAFSSCKDFKSVDIAESVTSMGASVFRDCSALTSVKLPDALKTIPKSCFESCTSLTDVTIPSTLEVIGENAFWQCTELSDVNLPETVRAIGKQAFRYCKIRRITIPEGVTALPDVVFGDCYYLREITIPSTVKSIGKEVFRHCINLAKVELPEGLTSMNTFAFYDCQALTEITLPSTLETCGDNVFSWCSNLTKVIARMEDPFTLPDGMFGETSESISLHIPDGTYDKYVAAGWTPEIFPGGIVYGDDTPTLNDQFTFTTVEGVEVTAVLSDIKNNYIQIGIGTTGNPAIDTETEGTITLPDTVEAFGNKYVITTIGGYAFRYATKVTDVRIPKSVTHIGRYGFGNMESLKTIDIPGSVKEMETASFYKCTGLEEITLHEGTETIGNYSFVLAAIKSVEIPKSVTYIGKNSFQACTQLDKVISRIEEPIEFGTETFASISKTCGLHVPEGTKDAYIEKGWTEEIFPGGIVYGDETLHKGQSFELTEADGTVMTYKVTDVNDMLVEITSVAVGEEADGCVEIKPQATDPVAGNTYTVSNIADKAFGSDVTKVLSRIEDPFVLNPKAFAEVAENCALHVPAGTKDTYIEKGWTEEVFPGGVVEGDDTLVKGDTFELTDEDGTVTTYRVTDVNDLKAEIVSVTAGEEAGGIVTIAETVTDPVNENDYTVSSIANGAFAEPLKAVKAETATPFEVTADAFPGIGDKCVLFVPKGTKDNYISNGWTEEVFKGGVHEENIRGDVNEDLTVDISDIVATINTMANPDESPWRYADVNGDTKVDISDVVAIINIIAGK